MPRVLAAAVAAACLVARGAADSAKQLADWQAASVAREAAAKGEPQFAPPPTKEWYVVTIANVSVGYMHTVATVDESTLTTMEVMDVQVSRGVDTSRMAFETVFAERPLTPGDTWAHLGEHARGGGVRIMAYDQRFANSEVKMNASVDAVDGITLTSYNGEKEHVSKLPLPDEEWLGRMRARLEFTRRCRLGEREITVQTMRPELGPRVVNLTSTFDRIEDVWDGEAWVEATHWSVHISDVPVNMSEAYPTSGPLRCYRMLQMGLDMPFGYLLASLGTEQAARAAAEDDPSRQLPELVYTMFVPLSAPIPNVYEASLVKMSVRVKGDKGPVNLELPTGGYQEVKQIDGQSQHLHVTIDLQNPLKATADELAQTEYLAPSAMVDSSDEVIIDLAHTIDAKLKKAGVRVPKRGKPAAEATAQLEMAYLLRDTVHEHISEKHLSTAYASASETARTGSGDCTEHAVLLAALLRARQIPSRVCHGLVYVELGGSAISGEAADSDSLDSPGAGEQGVAATVAADGSAHPAGEIHAAEGQPGGQFGWHMWTQALVNGRWMDLDATLHVPYSVGHVLVGTSSMSDKDAHNNHMQMAALIGNLEIVLLEYSHKWQQTR